MAYEEGGYAGSQDAVAGDTATDTANTQSGQAGDDGSALVSTGADDGSTIETYAFAASGGSGSSGSTFHFAQGGSQSGALLGKLSHAASGIFGAVSGFFKGGGNSSPDHLVLLAQEAYRLHGDYSNLAAAHVADAYGHPELNDKTANQQVVTMESQWKEVDVATAQKLANQGRLAIAGAVNAAGPGYAAVVMPGQGGQMDGSAPGAGDGPQNIASSLKYYTPRR